MREWVIGDIHGCVRALNRALEILRPGPDDTVILLGDYIDKGPDSCAVIEAILELNRKCTVIALAGNHEKLLLRAREEPATLPDWLDQGGRNTLASYHNHGYGSKIGDIPKAHWDFLAETTFDYWETDDFIFIHASLDPDLDLDEQPDFLLFWQRFSDPMAHHSGRPIICGHASQKSGRPVVFKGGICIDTWACGDGWLTSYDLTARTFLQTNDRGESRTFDLRSLEKPDDEP